MKKILLSLLVLLMLAAYAQARDVVIDGKSYRVDTVALFKAGPGTQYLALEFKGARRINAFFLKVDLTNPYVAYRAALGRDSIYGGEQPTQVAARKSKEKEVYIAGTNGDFYNVSDYVGMPIGCTVVNNELANNAATSYHRQVFAFDKSKVPYIGAMSYSGSLQIGTERYAINHVNHLREENQLVLYNQHNGQYTHTGADGTEVLLALSKGETWQLNKEIRAKVVSVVQNKGNMQIPVGGAVLSANGAIAGKLAALTAGTEVKIALNLSVGGVSAPFADVVGGDQRSPMLQDGSVNTTEVWNELHPRTGFGYTQDKKTAIHCVVDGRSTISSGATTKELAEIMQFVGAYTAMNLDGGGSSCLFLKDFGPMNKNSDGTERAVGNGIYVVSTAPTDNKITEIKSLQTKVRLPRYGIFKPMFYGYNQYGVLVSRDVAGVKQTVDAKVGEVLADGSFFASGNQSGVITASYNGATEKIEVELLPEAPIAIRLDSVLLDNKVAYPIEVQTEVGGNVFNLYPGAMKWEVADPSICTVTEGVVKGLRNGTTIVTGRLGNFTDQLKVHIEIADKPSLTARTFTDATWKVTHSANLKSVVNAPTSDAVKTTFTYKAGRNPYVAYNNDFPLYGLPDSIRLTFNAGETNINKLSFRFKENNGGMATINKEFQGFKKNKDNTISLALADLMDHPNDRAAYPLHFNFMQFSINGSGMTSDKGYDITIKEFVLVYKGTTTAIVRPTNSASQRVFVGGTKDNKLTLHLDFDKEEQVQVQLISMSGKVLRKVSLGVVGKGSYVIPMQQPMSGVYLLKVSYGNKHETIKVVM